jgi:hypothetical protein
MIEAAVDPVSIVKPVMVARAGCWLGSRAAVNRLVIGRVNTCSRSGTLLGFAITSAWALPRNANVSSNEYGAGAGRPCRTNRRDPP